MEKLKAVALYRASTKKQTDREHDCDIPLQKNIIRAFVKDKGWELIKEFTEGGISGYKVSANDRDAVQEIKKMALNKQFDVLVIYMSDRLGRISDETPLIVSYLNSHGIKIISYTEGEITSATHTDKLLTYIRYWQAEGESIKTSARVKDARANLVNQGGWPGGRTPYGYDAVYRGNSNFKGKPIKELVINEEEAAVVRKIFELTVDYNYGSRRIAQYLNDNNIKTKYGHEWKETLVRQTLRVETYKGYFFLKEDGKNSAYRARSPHIPEIEIIPEELWDKAQEALLKRRSNRNARPIATYGQMLLSGLAYCGYCGEKYTTISQRCYYTLVSGEDAGKKVSYKYMKYGCMSYFRPKTEQCHGAKVISCEKLDNLVVADIKRFLEGIDERKIAESNHENYTNEISSKKLELKRVNNLLSKNEAELRTLKNEVVKSIVGESKFSSALLNELLENKEKDVLTAHSKIIEIQGEIQKMETVLDAYVTMDDTLANWTDRFDAQDIEDKKQMLRQIIEKVIVYQDRVEIKYNINVENFAKKIFGLKCASSQTQKNVKKRLQRNNN